MKLSLPLLALLGTTLYPAYGQNVDADLVRSGRVANASNQFAPASFTVNGQTFAFDQAYLLSYFRTALEKCEKEMKQPDNSTPQTDSHARCALAYCIISAGLYAKKEPALSELLDRTQRLLANAPLPANVLSPIAALAACAAVSFRDRDGNPPDEDLAHMAPPNFGHLIFITQVQLKARAADQQSDHH